MSKFKALGVTDEVTVCDCCGKKNLKVTVCLEDTENGGEVYYGRDCAGMALYGRKNRKNAERAEYEAKIQAKLAPVVAAIKAQSPCLVDMLEAGNAACKGITINGMHVSVSGFASWGKINIYYNGGRIEIPLS